MFFFFQPIEVREFDPSKANLVEYVGVYSSNVDKTATLIGTATILENGRRVACDIGDADPERMSPPRIQEYIHANFDNTPIKINVIRQQEQLAKEYPLFEVRLPKD